MLECIELHLFSLLDIMGQLDDSLLNTLVTKTTTICETMEAIMIKRQMPTKASNIYHLNIKQVAFQSNANHLLAESMGYIKFEGM